MVVEKGNPIGQTDLARLEGTFGVLCKQPRTGYVELLRVPDTVYEHSKMFRFLPYACVTLVYTWNFECLPLTDRRFTA